MTRLMRIRLTWLGLEVLSAIAHRLARWGGFDDEPEPRVEPSDRHWRSREELN